MLKILVKFDGKKVLFILFFLFPSEFCSSQEKAIKLNLAITEDLAYNFNGEIDQGYVTLGNIDFTLTFDTERMNLWKGGSFFVYALNNHGKSLSDLVGDFQVVDNIEALSNTRLYEFWYRQEIGNVSITLGQHDLNSEFAISEYGIDAFIHSSFGIQPDISTNIPVSIFPVATLGAIIQWKISESLRFVNGIYDGDPGDELENPNSLTIKLGNKEGVITIHELQLSTNNNSIRKNTYKLGLWNRTTDIISDGVKYKNTQGIYFITDQLLFGEDEKRDQGLGVFAQIGIPLRSETGSIKSYLGGGLVYHGIFSGRDEDTMGIAFGRASFSDVYRKEHKKNAFENETAIEFNYKLVVNSHFTIQPNFQYVINPQGVNVYKNAFMGIVRLKFEI